MGGIQHSPHRILVVDDERVVRDAALRLLSSEGFGVLSAGDAEEALALLESEKPDFVVIDLKLPGLSGIEFLQAAREANPGVIVIVTTGYSSIDNAVDSLKSGAFDFLPKPFTFDELLSPVLRASRYRALTADERDVLAAQDAGTARLGMQGWARCERDGSAVLGGSRLFGRTIAPVVHVEAPEVGEMVQQGAPLVRLTTDVKLVHVLWSPLSGRVLDVNPLLAEDPEVIRRDPTGVGWLVRIKPLSLEQELENLSVLR